MKFAFIDDESGEKAVSVLLSGEESELIFIDHGYTEMTVSAFTPPPPPPLSLLFIHTQICLTLLNAISSKVNPSIHSTTQPYRYSICDIS